METELLNELKESIRQVKAIESGELAPARVRENRITGFNGSVCLATKRHKKLKKEGERKSERSANHI